MSDDLPDEISRLYRYVKQLDRYFTKLRHNSISRQSILSATKFVLIFVLLIPAVAAVIFLVHRTHTQFILLAGPAGSTTAHLAPRIQSILNESAPIEQLLRLNVIPDFELRSSCGGLDTSAQIKAGIAHLGFAEDGFPEGSTTLMQCSLSGQMPAQTRDSGLNEKMRVLMLLYKSPLHVVARAKLEFKDVHGLPSGTKVYLGPDGSATNFVGQLVVDHFGLNLDRKGYTLDFDQAAQGLIDGEFDVAFFLVGLQTEVIKSLLQQNSEFELLPIAQAASLKMLFPYLESLTIPSAIYPNVQSEIQTIGTNTVLVASTALGESEAYEVTKKVAEHIQDILWDVPLNLARVIDNDPSKDLFYPIHDGARRFFAHNPPFLLDLGMLTGIGAYFSVIYAFYVMLLELLRNYRVYRLLMIIDLILGRMQMLGDSQNSKRLNAHLQKLRRIALQLMRLRKINYDEFSHIEDYIKAHQL